MTGIEKMNYLSCIEQTISDQCHITDVRIENNRMEIDYVEFDNNGQPVICQETIRFYGNALEGQITERPILHITFLGNG